MAANKRTGSTAGKRTNKARASNKQQGLGYPATKNRLRAALVAGGAVAAGLFLWSRRSSLSDRIGEAGNQLGELRNEFGSDDQEQSASVSSRETPKARKRGRRSQVEIAEEALKLKTEGATQSPQWPEQQS